MSADKTHEFIIAIDDFDTSLLPPYARKPGSAAFSEEVTKLLTREYTSFGGRCRIIVSDKHITVSWREGEENPLTQALDDLSSGDYSSGVAKLKALLRATPNDPDVLYNLGLALSDLNDLDESSNLLERAVSQRPDHVNSLVGLGVAQQRMGNTAEAIETLQRAIVADDSNPWAHRNLGACLLKQGDADSALEHLRRATELNPEDQSAWFGLGQAHEERNEPEDADDSYARLIKLDPDSQIAELAKERRSQIGQAEMRARVGGGLRPDAMMYCLGALEKFSAMSPDERQQCAFEIAMRGQRGFDFNDSTQKYEFQSVPGRMSGLQALAYMYVGFKYVAPDMDIGFDLSREYEAAKEMFKGNAP